MILYFSRVQRPADTVKKDASILTTSRHNCCIRREILEMYLQPAGDASEDSPSRCILTWQMHLQMHRQLFTRVYTIVQIWTPCPCPLHRNRADNGIPTYNTRSTIPYMREDHQ
jgi:hypothetical protein